MQISWACFGIGLVILIVGFVMFFGGLHVFFRSWKRMPEEERKKIRIKPLCRNIGGVIALCGVIVLVAAFWPYFLDKMFSWFMIAWFILAAVDLVWISKSSRYIDRPDKK
ncbi:MAG: DUF3784 domain-containing protein [Clostridia bacterium]|nr:DUF3784 domain-containing protein [Clostridia bacterium]